MSEIHFSSSVLGGILKSPRVRAGVAAEAERVADHVRGQSIEVGAFEGGQGPIDLPVRVTSETTDRAVAFVTLAHPAGIAVQAKLGALSKAAAATGLSIRGD